MTVREMFEAYRAAFERGDTAWIAARCDIPLTVVRPERSAIVCSRAKLRAELGKIFDSYLWMGLHRVLLLSLEEVGFEDGLGQVNVSWGLADREGRAITSIDTTYLLRRVGRALRIATIVAHNEEDRRLRLVHASTGTPGA